MSTSLITTLPPSLALAQGGLVHRIVTSLPTDPASLFTLMIIVVAVGWVLWFGRSGGDDDGKPA